MCSISIYYVHCCILIGNWTGLVYQDTAADVIYHPIGVEEGVTRVPHVSSGAPGFIGRMTGMNVYGVSIGVDLLRAAPCTPDTPGLNSALLMRYILDTAVNTSHAVQLMAAAPRGVTWLYPICDGNGDCVIVEAGQYMEDDESFDPLQYVNNSDVKEALPSQDFYDTHSSQKYFHNGLYARPMDYTYPAEYLDYNKNLYALVDAPYSDSADVWGSEGFCFDTFDQENEITVDYLHNNFFPPQREEMSDVIIIANNAIIPEFRTSMMSYGGNFWEVCAFIVVEYVCICMWFIIFACCLNIIVVHELVTRCCIHGASIKIDVSNIV